jgi:DNA polymerase III epsilon subunit-like protein
MFTIYFSGMIFNNSTSHNIMYCKACGDLCVRPHLLYKCHHTVCHPCLGESSLRVFLCPVGSCGMHGPARFLLKLTNSLQANYAQEYRILDQAKPMRTSSSVSLLESIRCSEKKKKHMPDSVGELPHLYYYLDFEATDKTPMTCRITQIGCVGVMADGKTMKTYNELVKADQKICAIASEITGITDAKLRHSPPCLDSLRAFFEWIDHTREKHPVVLVAHNGIGYDYPLMMSEMYRWDMAPYHTLKRYGIRYLFDTLAWARVNLPSHKLIKKPTGESSFRLGDIHEALVGFRFDGAHDALADCHALRRICESEYVARKNMCMTNSDSHSCLNLLECVKDFQTKRQNIDKITHVRVQQKVVQKSKRTLLAYFKPNDGKRCKSSK